MKIKVGDFVLVLQTASCDKDWKGKIGLVDEAYEKSYRHIIRDYRGRNSISAGWLSHELKRIPTTKTALYKFRDWGVE